MQQLILQDTTRKRQEEYQSRGRRSSLPSSSAKSNGYYGEDVLRFGATQGKGSVSQFSRQRSASLIPQLPSSILPHLPKEVIKDDETDDTTSIRTQLPPIGSSGKYFPSKIKGDLNLHGSEEDILSFSVKQDSLGLNAPFTTVSELNTKDSKIHVKDNRIKNERSTKVIKFEDLNSDSMSDCGTNNSHLAPNSSKKTSILRRNSVGFCGGVRSKSLPSFKNWESAGTLTNDSNSYSVNSLQPQKSHSRSRSIPLILKEMPNAIHRYPLATRYFKQWAGRFISNPKVVKNELEELQEDPEGDESNECTVKLDARFPSSKEFVQVLNDLCTGGKTDIT